MGAAVGIGKGSVHPELKHPKQDGGELKNKMAVNLKTRWRRLSVSQGEVCY